jgi:hypothetical protein
MCPPIRYPCNQFSSKIFDRNFRQFWGPDRPARAQIWQIRYQLVNFKNLTH